MLWWNVDPKDKLCPLSDFWAIICNLLVKLETVLENEFCLRLETCAMGSADAAFVTAAPQLVVFWVSASFAATQPELWTSNDFLLTMPSAYWLHGDRYQTRTAGIWPSRLHIHAFMRTCSVWELQKQRDRILVQVQFRVCLKIMFDQSTKGQ